MVEAAAYHEDGSRMGHILVQLHRKDPLGVDDDERDGMIWGAHMLGVEDLYYQWWYESTFGKLDDHKEVFIHFCLLRKRKPMRQAESALKLRRTSKKKMKKAEKKKREQKRARGAEDGDSDGSSDSSTKESFFDMARLPEGIDRLKKTHLEKPDRLADLTLQRYKRGADSERRRSAAASGSSLPPASILREKPSDKPGPKDNTGCGPSCWSWTT